MSKPKRVIVAVGGGVADPFHIPKGVEVEVRDYDSVEFDADDDPGRKVDVTGRLYCESVYRSNE
jgi:hypothetical protein